MNKNENILAEIAERMSRFSKSQRKVAEFIVNNSEKSAYMTAAKLSEKVGVSEATVVRFAYEVVSDGYPGLQKRLAELAKSQLTPMQRMELAYEKNAGRDLLYHTLKRDIGYIESTLENVDRELFEAAAATISSADKIYITGVRSSAALAEFAGFYLHLIFDNVHLIKSTGGDGIFEQILNIGKGDALIGISFPRYSKNTIKAMDYAKKSGAAVIGITDSGSSPVNAVSDIVLTAESGTASFIDSLTAPLSMINALLSAVGMMNKDRIGRNLERLEQIWDEYEVYDKK